MIKKINNILSKLDFIIAIELTIKEILFFMWIVALTILILIKI